MSYNTGTLINAPGKYLECGQGRNIWNEEWGNYHWDEITNGTRNNDNACFGSEDYIKVLPNTTYYFRSSTDNFFYILFYDNDKNYLNSYLYIVTNNTFNTPENCEYITFYSFLSYGTTYNHDICINVSDTNFNGTYVSYIAPKVIDTGSEVLRSAGSIYDYKIPDGTITRRVGRVDLGTLNWTYDGNKRFKASLLNSANTHIDYSTTLNNTTCPLYTASADIWGNDIGNYILGISGYDLYIRNTSYTDAAAFKAAMSGVILYYELETPTTEQGTSFQEDITINDYSYML